MRGNSALTGLVVLIVVTSVLAPVVSAGPGALLTGNDPSAPASDTSFVSRTSLTTQPSFAPMNESTEPNGVPDSAPAVDSSGRPENPKVASNLLGGSTSRRTSFAAGDGRSSTDVTVVVRARQGQTSAVERIGSRYGEIVTRHGNRVVVRLPRDNVTSLANEAAVGYVRPQVPTTTFGEITSEGVDTMNATRMQQLGYDGENVTVAVVDYHFDVSNPEIAENVVATKAFSPYYSTPFDDADTHGTACIELAVDTAPNASVVAIAVGGTTSMQNAMDWIANNSSIDVVSMSVGPLAGYPLDGTSGISQDIDDVVASGKPVFMSAGNEANGDHWNGTWRDGDSDALLNFTATDETMGIGTGYVDVTVQWHDWPSSNDYDLFLINESGGVVAASTSVQNGTQPPVERITYDGDSSEHYALVVERWNANGTAEFNAFVSGGDFEHYTATQSLVVPATGRNVTAVAAMDYYDRRMEAFSSQGPTVDGRRKPELTAPDNVSTTAYDGGFYGTSAAAPHAAGAAALLLDANPHLSAEEVEQTLQQTAVPVTGTEPNTISGYGLVDVAAAIQSLNYTMSDQCRVIDNEGTHVLKQDLPDRLDTCLVVSASNVTVDGNGHTIDGRGTGAGIRVAANTTITNITVRNVTITEFATGIDAGKNVSDLTIRNVTVASATTGIAANGTGTLRLHGAAVDDGTTSIAVSNVTSLTIAGRSFTDATQTGIDVVDTADATIANVTVAPATGATGLALTRSPNAVIRDSRVTGGDAVRLSASDRAAVVATNVSGATRGIVALESGNVTARDVTALRTTWAYYGAGEPAANDLTNFTIALNDSVTVHARHVALGLDGKPPAPPGYTAQVGAALNVTNTSGGGAWAVVNVSYTPKPSINESSLRLWRHDGANWSRVGTANTVNQSAQYVSANVTSFETASGGVSTVAALGQGLPVANASPADIDYGALLVNHSAARNVTLANDGIAPLNVTNVSISGPGAGAYTLTSNASFVLAPDASRNVSVTFAPAAEGAYNATLSIEHNDTDQSPVDVTLNGSAVAAPVANVTLDALDYGRVHLGATANRTVTVVNEGTRVLNLSNVTITGGGGAYSVVDAPNATVDPGTRTTITVAFSPTARGSTPATLSIEHNGTDVAGVAGDASPATVSLEGTGVAPRIDVDSGGLIETVTVGTPENYKLNVSNPGNAPLRVQSVAFTEDEPVFTLSTSGPFTVAAGGTRTVTVTASPSSVGTYNATVRFTHNVSGVGAKTVRLSIRATSPPTQVAGGGGGGGGGQAGKPEARTSVTNTESGATVSVREAPIGATITADLDGVASDLGAVTQLNLSLKFDERYFRIEVTPPTASPTGAPVLDRGRAIAYFRADSVNLPATTLRRATITFRVAEQALPSGASPDDVVLYRYHDGAWRALETTYAGDDTYTARTPGFSAFAIGLAPEPAPTPTATPQSTGTPSIGTSTQTARPGSTTTTSTTGPGFGPLTALVALIALGRLLAGRRQ